MISNKFFYYIWIFLILENSAFESFLDKEHDADELSSFHRSITHNKRQADWRRYRTMFPSTLTDVENEITKCFDEPKIWCNDKTKYRSIDGSCNNLNLRSWGMANTALFRVVAAHYDDEICSVRTIDEKPLPSALKIGQITSNVDRPPLMQNISTFFAIFAQIVVDDVASIIIKPADRNFCCSNITNTTYDNPSCDCMPTSIPQGTGNCTKFARSKTTFTVQCPAFPIHQLSSVTSFLDASFLYSSDSNDLAVLRTNKNGKLKVEMDKEGRPFSKMYKTNKNVSHDTERTQAHVNTGTKTLTTMFLRLHNFLCDILSWLNPSWDDEITFQEARRLLIAMYQHVVYYEFLPAIIGYDYSRRYDLISKKNKLHETYDPSINPTTVNSFTTAAFRYFHAFFPASIRLVNKRYHITKNISFVATPNDINLMEGDWYDSVIRGSTTFPIMESEQWESRKRRFLHATDTERARDHGLRSYNDYREACGLDRIYNFRQLQNLINSEDVSKLTEIYQDVDHIELYVGGMLENPVQDALVGPTFQCLIAEAFYRYKYGDRFFYEHKNVLGQFTREQLQEIKKVTASLLVCISSDAIMKVQTNIFYLPSTLNPFLPCDLLLRPDYTGWQEKPTKSKSIFK